jgi:hypothetical protein
VRLRTYSEHKKYSEFTQRLIRGAHFADYLHNPCYFDAYLEWLASQDRLFTCVYNFVEEWLFEATEAGGARLRSAGSDLLIECKTKLVDLGGIEMLKEALVHIIIYSYVKLQPYSSPSGDEKAWGEVEGKVYYSATTNSFFDFIFYANLLGCGITISRSDKQVIRHFMFRLLQALCESAVFTKISYTHYSKDVKKPQSAYKLLFNVWVSSKCAAVRAHLADKPPVARIVDGEAIYLNKHFMAMRRIIKQNKKSSGRSLIYNAAVFTAASSVRYRLDPSLVEINIDILLRAYRIDKELVGLAPLSERIRFLEDLAGRGDKGQKKVCYEEITGLRLLLDLLLFAEEASSFKDGFYFYYFADFRGRVYVNSPLSPTTNKNIRYSIKFDDYVPDAISKSTIEGDYLSVYRAYANLIGRPDLSEFQKYIAACVLIDIGKIFKSEAGGRASILDFARLGAKH